MYQPMRTIINNGDIVAKHLYVIVTAHLSCISSHLIDSSISSASHSTLVHHGSRVLFRL